MPPTIVSILFLEFYYLPIWPVLTEHGVVQNYLLKKLNEFIREISRHKCFHSHRHFFRILRLWQSSLHNLCGGKKYSQSTADFQNNIPNTDTGAIILT